MVRVVKLAALIAIAIGLTAPAVANASGGDGVAKPRPHTPRAARTAHVAPGDAEELPAELYQWIQVPGPAEVQPATDKGDATKRNKDSMNPPVGTHLVPVLPFDPGSLACGGLGVTC